MDGVTVAVLPALDDKMTKGAGTTMKTSTS